MRFREFDRRLAAVLWIGLIYATIPFVRRLREAFAARWPAVIIGYAVVAVIAIAAAIAVAHLHRSRSRIRSVDILWLVGVAAVAVAWTRHLMGQPEEAVHFLEYGILGVLLYRALENRVTNWTIYPSVVAAGVLVGTVDELIQWVTPDRFWDFRDIVLNGSAVALVQVAIWRLAPRRPTRVCAPSLRLFCRLAAAEVLLLTLCLAATPARLALLADSIPLPKRMATGADAICEYGYRHSLDELTVFFSRFSRSELAELDRVRAPEVARLFEQDRSRRESSRTSYSPVENPYAYEIRVHIFARNRNLHRARPEEPGSAAYRQLMTTAWRENLILEEVFTTAMDLSHHRWGPRVRAEAEAAQDPGAPFVSRVAGHLITRLNEGHLRLLMSALFAVLVACDVLSSARSRPESPPG